MYLPLMRDNFHFFIFSFDLFLVWFNFLSCYACLFFIIFAFRYSLPRNLFLFVLLLLEDFRKTPLIDFSFIWLQITIEKLSKITFTFKFPSTIMCYLIWISPSNGKSCKISFCCILLFHMSRKLTLMLLLISSFNRSQISPRVLY